MLSNFLPKILTILKRKKQWVNPTLKNEYELLRFKACDVYPRVRSFWIYTLLISLKPSLPSSCMCMLKNLVFSKKKLKKLKKKKKNLVY